MKERHIRVNRTARYYTLGTDGPHLGEVWLVCHGYRQLARRFLPRFDGLDDGTRLIVAPEALSRFYLHDRMTGDRKEVPVGATWMTREHRESEIADYVAYLDAVLHEATGSPVVQSGGDLGVASVGATSAESGVEIAPLTVLGFSQGSHTVCRWVAAGAGAGAIMAIPPLSQGLAEPQLAEYFEELLEEVALPIIIQDASSYVGKAMSLPFQAELFRKQGERILFKPEAAPLGPCISALRDLTGGQAKIFEGSGGVLLIDSYRRGVAGTIPGVEILAGLVALWNACVAGDWDRAYEVYLPICAIATLQMQGGLDGYIVTERHLLYRQGLFPNQVHRGPLAYQLDYETRGEIDRLYDRLQAVLRR